MADRLVRDGVAGRARYSTPAMLPLIAAGVGLLVGPILSSLSPGSQAWRQAVDGLSLALVGGLCLLHLAPHALEHGGLLALGAGAIGALLPVLAHRAGHGRDRAWHAIALSLLALHAATDGAILAVAEAGVGPSVALAVAAHRLPVGLAVFDAAQDTPRIAWAAIAALMVATLVGYGAGAGVAHAIPDALHGVLEGLIVGVLLHTVLAHHSHPPHRPHRHHAPHTHDHDHHAHEHHAPHTHTQDRPGPAGAFGALVGLVLLAGFTQSADAGALHHVEETAATFLALTLDSAPALLLGFVLAGLVSSFLDPAGATWLARGGRLGQALRGVGFGLPLPVCSCGVVPMYGSLIRKGVPTTAALAFLVATPELGIDAVLLSIPLLGVPMTVARVVAALLAALVVAVLVGSVAADVAPTAVPPAPRPAATRLRRGLAYGLGELVDHTLPWIVVGLAAAALAEPLFGHDLLLGLPAGLQVPLAAIVGIPVYVCASGATPLAAIAVHKGLSAGAALALLIAGPATNATTFGVLAALHGRGVAIRFGLALVSIAVGVGWAIDLIGVASPQLLHPPGAEAEGSRPVAWWSTAAIAALAVASLFRQGPRGVVGQITHPIHTH